MIVGKSCLCFPPQMHKSLQTTGPIWALYVQAAGPYTFRGLMSEP